MDENNTIQYVPQIDNSELKRGLEEARAMWQQMVKDVERSGNHMQNIWQNVTDSLIEKTFTHTFSDLTANILEASDVSKQLGTAFDTMQSSGSNAASGIGAALKTNAIDLALTAIAITVQAVITAVRKANEVTREMKKAIDGGVTSVEKETSELDLLYGRLKQAEKGTQEYEAAKKAIISAYGPQLAALGNENGAVMDLTESYEGLRAAIIDTANARAMDAVMQKSSDIASKKYSETYDKIETMLTKKFGKEKAAEYMIQLTPVLRGTGELTPQINSFLRFFDKVGAAAFDEHSGKTTTLISNPIKSLISKLKEVYAETNESISEAITKFGTPVIDIPDSFDETTASFDSLIALLPAAKSKLEKLQKTLAPEDETLKKQQELVNRIQGAIDANIAAGRTSKKYWDDQVRELEAVAAAIDPALRKGEEWENLCARLENAKKNASAWDLPTSTQTGGNTTDDGLERQEKLNAALLQLENDYQQLQIDAMEEGAAKQRAQRLHNAKQALEDERERLAEIAQLQGGNLTAGNLRDFYNDTDENRAALLAGGLTEEQVEQFYNNIFSLRTQYQRDVAKIDEDNYNSLSISISNFL